MKLDDIDWHESALEKGQPQEYAGAHIAFFVRWLAQGDYLDPDANFNQKSVKALKSDKVSAYMFLEKECDGKLFDDMVIAEMRDFLKSYYSTKPLKGWSTYLIDIEQIIGKEKLYKSAEESINKKQAFKLLDQRLEEWKTTYSKKPKSFLSKLLGR